jgi:uncharacterized protein YeaO (DUF488 family)
MIYTTYLSNLKNLPKGVTTIQVCRRPAPGSVLAPSAKLLADYKLGLISWEKYEEQYRLELISSQVAFDYLYQLKSLGMSKDIYLWCYEKDETHCHRTILLDILKRAEAKIGGEYHAATLL